MASPAIVATTQTLDPLLMDEYKGSKGGRRRKRKKKKARRSTTGRRDYGETRTARAMGDPGDHEYR